MTDGPLPALPDRNHEDTAIMALFREGVVERFVKEETIINGLEEADGVYLIKGGFVKAYSTSSKGHGNLLMVHTVGELIPLPWALDGVIFTGLFYEAMTDVEVLRLPKAQLHNAMDNDAHLTKEVLRQAVRIIARCTQRIQALEFRTARERVIAQLLHMAEQYGTRRGTETLIDIVFTHQDLADSINMTRETASRALGSLFKAGLVRQDDHLVTIPDLAALHKALHR